MGTKAGETSPLARVRRYNDALALRLLVDLYYDQNLRDDSGISRRVLRQRYTRTLVGQQGIYTVWAFKPENLFMSRTDTTEVYWAPGDQPDFWSRLNILRQEGLIQFVPHLCESDDLDSEVIHPYGTDWWNGDLRDLENAVGHAAHAAGCEMASRQKLDAVLAADANHVGGTQFERIMREAFLGCKSDYPEPRTNLSP